MNQKRWAALGVAGAILLFSIITQITTSIVSFQSEETSMSFMDEILQSDSGITEYILEEGDINNRIVVLQVNGTITDSGSSSFLDTEDNKKKLTSYSKAVPMSLAEGPLYLEVGVFSLFLIKPTENNCSTTIVYTY